MDISLTVQRLPESLCFDVDITNVKRVTSRLSDNRVCVSINDNSTIDIHRRGHDNIVRHYDIMDVDFCECKEVFSGKNVIVTRVVHLDMMDDMDFDV